MGMMSKSGGGDMRRSREQLLANTPIVICLVGITGEGKSTTGNTISGEKNAFQASAKSRSVTRGCAFIDFQMNNVAYRVIDTPGLQDTNLTPAELLSRFKQFADLAPQGVDTFLFVCKRGRFKPEHVQAFHTFQEACTSEALAHTAFLFTNLDEETNDEFTHALREEAVEVPNLVECLRKVNGRVIGIDNKGGAARSAADRTLVIELVSQIKSINLGRRYSNEFLHEADEWRRAVEAQAIKLESFDHRETMKAELDELLHGRRSRAQVETKLTELWKAEEEARRVLEEAEAARKAKERAEEEMRIMQAQAEAARRAKEEAALREEQRRIEAGMKRRAHERKSTKELADRSEARALLIQKLQGDPVDISVLQQAPQFDDYPFPEREDEVYSPPKKRIEQRSLDEQLRLLEQETPRKRLDEDDYAKAMQKREQEEQLKKAGQENLAWLLGEITKEKFEKQMQEIHTKAEYPAPVAQPMQSQSHAAHTQEQVKSLWERESVTSRDSTDTTSRSMGTSGPLSTGTSSSAKISLAGPLSEVELSPREQTVPRRTGNLPQTSSLFSSESERNPPFRRDAMTISPRVTISPRDFTARTLVSSDYRTGLTSTLYDPPMRMFSVPATPDTTHRSLLTMTEKRSFLGSKERGSLLSPDLAEILTKIADNGSVSERMRMGA